MSRKIDFEGPSAVAALLGVMLLGSTLVSFGDWALYGAPLLQAVIYCGAAGIALGIAVAGATDS